MDRRRLVHPCTRRPCMPNPSKGESYIGDDQGENRSVGNGEEWISRRNKAMSITPRTDSIVAILNTHTEVEKIVKELQMAGL